LLGAIDASRRITTLALKIIESAAASSHQPDSLAAASGMRTGTRGIAAALFE